MTACRRLPALCGGGIWDEIFSDAMPDATIHVAGKILERLREILYRVELPNGKVITGHLSKPLTDAKASFEDGQMVVLELTAYDFEAGRILGRTG